MDEKADENVKSYDPMRKVPLFLNSPEKYSFSLFFLKKNLDN